MRTKLPVLAMHPFSDAARMEVQIKPIKPVLTVTVNIHLLDVVMMEPL